MSEAIEAARGSVQLALQNLSFQVMFGETRAVIQMYEDAAIRLGASQDQIDRAKRR